MYNLCDTAHTSPAPPVLYEHLLGITPALPASPELCGHALGPRASVALCGRLYCSTAFAFFFFKNACVSCILHSLCKHFRVFLYCLDFPLRLKGARGDRLETRSQVGCCVCRPNIWTTKREKAAEQSHSTVQIHPIASFPLSTIRFPSVSTLATSLSLFLLRCLPRYPYERVHSCLARWHSGLESLIYGSTQCPCTIAWKRVQLL